MRRFLADIQLLKHEMPLVPAVRGVIMSLRKKKAAEAAQVSALLFTLLFNAIG
jgi:hypothetical protein